MNRIITLVLVSCLLNLFQVSAQTLDQPANWPNASWALSGSFNAGGLSGDPTASDATFIFDDDAAGNGSSDNLILTSPVIDLTAASGAGETWITVSGNFTYYALGGDFLGIETYDADTMTWSQLEQFSGNTTTVADYQNCLVSEAYTSQVLDISSFTATQLSGFQYRFRYNDQSGWQYGFCVESPTVSSAAPPSCLDPTALTATSITDTNATLGWTENGTASLWDVEIITQGTPSTGTPTATGVGNPYVATGLTAETAYDFYVRADCGAGGTSNWSGPFTFTTTCAPVDAPYNEDFETFTPSSSSFDNENCWDATNASSSYFWESALGTDTSSGGTGPDPTITTGNYFFIEASGSSVGDVAELNTPIVNLSPLTAPSLTFNYHMHGDQIGTLEVIVNGTSTEWTLSGEQQTTATEPWETAIVDLNAYSGQSIALTFRATGAGTFEGDIAIDNVAFDELPACPAPSSLTTSNITDTTADLGWNENGTATVWDVEVVDVTAGGTVSGTPTATGISNPYTATGLTQDNDYEFYVRADCGSGTVSDWAGPFSFTTLETCPSPSALTAANIAETSADLSWTENGVATVWNIELVDVTAGGSATGVATETGVSTNPYSITGLSGDNSYEFYVQADCGGDGTSAWVGPFAFSTPYVAVPPNCSNGTFLDSGGRSGNYASSENTTYTICPDNPGEIVSINFTAFSTENNGSSACYDGLTIYNGADNTASTIDPPGGGTIWCWDRNDSPAAGTGDLQGMTITSTDPSGCITFVFTSDGSVTRSGWEAVVSCIAGPSCTAPSTLTASNITSSSADLGWTAGDSETVWDIEWGADGFTQGMGTMIDDTSDNPYTLSGLMSNTAYEFYVRADCGAGDESTWTGPFDFTTTPATVALPISEGFESGLTVFDNAPGNSTDWVVNTSYFKVGSQSLSNAHGGSNTNTLLQTSVFDLSSTPDAVLQFWHIAKLEGGWDKGFVEISTDGGATYSPLPASTYLGHSDDYDTEGYFHEDSYEIWGTTNTTPDNSTWWKRETFDLSAYSSSSMRLRFRLTSDGGVNRAGWFIDDITVKEAFVYEGGAWNTSPVGVSDASSTTIIKDGTVIPSGSFTTGDLIIQSGATLNTGSGSTTVSSYMDNSGQIRGGNRLIISGMSSSEVVGTGLIGNLEINNSNGVVINGEQSVLGRLFLNAGILTTNDGLTLKSRSNNTAALADHDPLTSSISGNVTVERFIPASNRAYRFLTTSVSGQSVFDAWQESGDNSNGFGTQITGTVGSVGNVNATTGHDETTTGNSSMFEYDPISNNWSSISNTKAEILNAGTFYRLLIRGNRTTDLSTNTGTVTDVTLRSTGTLIEGAVTVNGTGTGNYLGIGNPYQAQVDMSATTRSSIAADMYYYDPTLGSQGAYTYIEIATGANTNGTTSNAANILHPGQAVFLLESGASASIEFNENDKTTASTQNIGIFSNPTTAVYLNLRLLAVPPGASTPTNLDGLMMKFDATENLALDFDDARKWQNLDENLAIDKGNNELLAIERRPQPIADEIVNLSLTQYRSTDYQFEGTLDLLPGLKAYIKDNLNNTMTEIIQGGASATTSYSFTVDPNNPQSVASDRFQLVFETVTLGIDPDNVGAISIYPNPVTADELTIALGSNMSGQDVQINVYNSVGQLIRSVSENTGSSSMISLSGMGDMADGIYFVSLKGENLEHTEKIVIK